MPLTTNRAPRSNKPDDDERRSLIERRESKGGGDSDSLMSGGASDDEDDGEEEGEEEDDDDEGEGGEDENGTRAANLFKGEFIMPPYEHAKRQLAQLYELMNGPYLDLAPHYQRGVVWSQKAMRLLIDSMWKGYYIPPVIFNLEIVKDENGVMRFKRTCVDGKQRLTSIREFMSGHFACMINKKPWYFCAPPGPPRQGPRRKILPEAAKEEFKRIEILCTEYKGLTQRQEIELFQRVQLGKPLSQAEAFRATQGSWQDFAKLYERDFSDVINLVKQSRASGFRQVLNSFMQIYECIDPTGADGIPKFKNSIKSIESFCANAILDMETKSHLQFVFTLFHDLVEEDRSTFEYNGYTRTKTFSPIELVGVCCLLSQKGAERPNGMLRGDILAMRAHLREIHSDLRMNKTCWDTVWRFIDKLEYYRGAVGGTTVRKAPTKAIKRKPRPRPQPQAAPVVEDRPELSGNGQHSSVPGGTSQKAPAANMARPNPRPKPNAGLGRDDQNALGANLISQLSAAASSPDRVPNSDLNAASGAPRNNASHSASPSISPPSNPVLPPDIPSRRAPPPPPPPPPSSAAAASNIRRTMVNDRSSSQAITASNRRKSFTPGMTPGSTSAESAVGEQGQGQGHVPAPVPGARKRVALDLGFSNTGNNELEYKKARLMAGYVKQEKDT